MPLQPKHLDYANAQFLIIGEGQGSTSKATEPQSQDEKEGKENPLDEMDTLEDEDEIRVKNLNGETTGFLLVHFFHFSNHRANATPGDDAVFSDLQISSKEYPKLQTTW